MASERITEEMVWAAFDKLPSLNKRLGLDECEDEIRRAVAAVERAVIERLAGEAGENPYLPYTTTEGERIGLDTHRAWAEGAAAGVAAERARLADLIENEGNERA